MRSDFFIIRSYSLMFGYVVNILRDAEMRRQLVPPTTHGRIQEPLGDPLRIPNRLFLLTVYVGCIACSGKTIRGDGAVDGIPDSEGDLASDDHVDISSDVLVDEEVASDPVEECDQQTVCGPALDNCRADYECLRTGCLACQICNVDFYCDHFTMECECTGDGLCHEPCQLDGDCPVGEQCHFTMWCCDYTDACSQPISFCMPM
jgi:hypothetical protein